jgi:hypothetical protein
VLFMCTPAHNMGTSVPMTNGDNAGLATGVASGVVMGPSRHLTGAFTCLVGGLPAHPRDQRVAAELDQLPGRARRAQPGQGPAAGALSRALVRYSPR